MKCFFVFLFSVCIQYALYSQTQFQNQANTLGVLTSAGNTFLGNGVSFYDFDNDGWDDITIATSNNSPLKFYKNNNGVFIEQDFGLSSINYQTKSVTWIDYDNDGDNDLFVTSDTNGNTLLENQGSMVFQDITANSGMILSNLFTYGASWGDYDNDGFLDLFLNNRTDTISNKLFKNNGDGTFVDVTSISGLDADIAFSFCSTFFDMNNDGYLDLYVSNDKLSHENKLYKNNGDGTFSDISESSGTNAIIDAMTVTVGDYDNDGFFDIYVTNNPSGNILYKNNGDETFEDVTSSTGTAFNSIGWGANFFDADNDKDLDLYVSGQFDGSIGSFLSSAFYENDNTNLFGLNNACFPGDTAESYSNAIGDINNDGLLDVLVSNNNQNVYLWKNESVNSSNWIRLKLIGLQSNKNAIGARIEISINGEKQYRMLKCGEGYLAQNSSVEHFGVGTDTVIDYIKINWPSGLEETLYDIQANQTLSLVEGDNSLSTVDVSRLKNYIYPNPSNGQLHIKSLKTIKELYVTNLLGQKLMYYPLLNGNKIDVSSLEIGQYILSFKIDHITINHKFIKR